MFVKSTAALAAAIAFGGFAIATAPASAAPAGIATAVSIENSGYLIQARHGGPHGRYVARIQASGSASGKLVPYFVKKNKAQRQAIQNWNNRVSRAYGSRYANWNRATAKSTTCSRSATSVTCRVSARPASFR